MDQRDYTTGIFYRDGGSNVLPTYNGIPYGPPPIPDSFGQRGQAPAAPGGILHSTNPAHGQPPWMHDPASHMNRAEGDPSSPKDKDDMKARVANARGPPPPMITNSKGYRFEIKVVQEPDRARMCGYGDKVRLFSHRVLTIIAECN